MPRRRPRRRPVRWSAALARGLPWALGALGCAVAQAAAPTFAIDSLFSNADGSIQYVILREMQGRNGQDAFAGLTLVAHSGTGVSTFVFPANLPRSDTSRRSVLVATQGYVDAGADAPEFAAVAPDFVVPDRFLPTGGGSIAFADADTFDYPALPADGVGAWYRSGEVRDNEVQDLAGHIVRLPVTLVAAVEFYNATLDHYFITDLAADLVALDSGAIPGWSRTGASFAVWPTSFGFLAGVCRFYIPPEHGNSHFFSASADECARVAELARTQPSFSGYVLETDAAFFVAVPFADGACPTHWVPVYRLWNHRADSNHRYTTDPAIKAQMLQRGYVAEGTGADAVAMCSPLP